MAPTTAAPTDQITVTRPRVRRRREPSPLDQLPAWTELVPVMAPSPVPHHAVGTRSAARRAEPGPAACGHAWDRASARRRGGGHRQDPGHHAADRVAHRDPASEAVGDPRPDVHRQGGRGDGRSGRPARAVRLHGHVDQHLPRVRRPDHPRVRPRARAADRRPRPDPGRGRDLPARAPLRIRPRRVPAARRPDAVPGRSRDVVQPVQGRGHLARRTTWRMRIAWRPRRRGSARPPARTTTR